MTVQGLNLEMPPKALAPNTLYIFEFVIRDPIIMEPLTNCSI